MTVEIAYRWRYTDKWHVMTESTVSERSPADLYAVVIDGQRTYKNESLAKVQTVARRVKHTADLLELSQLA